MNDLGETEVQGLPQPPKRSPPSRPIGPSLPKGFGGAGSFRYNGSRSRVGPRLSRAMGGGFRHVKRFGPTLPKGFAREGRRQGPIAPWHLRTSKSRQGPARPWHLSRVRKQHGPLLPRHLGGGFRHVKRFGPRLPKGLKRGRRPRAPKPRQLRASSRRSASFNWLALLRKLSRLASAGKSDFRNHGFKGSGQKGLTGRAGFGPPKGRLW